MLIFDQKHFESTGLYMLYTPDRQEFYVFDNAVEAKQFIDGYYENKTCAQFGYMCYLNGKELKA